MSRRVGGADEEDRLDVLDYLTHSIRNPLEVAAIRAEVARDTGDLDHLDAVTRAHDRIETIVADAVALSRTGDVVDETTPTDLAGVARDAWSTVETGDATVRVGDPGAVLADTGRLRELFENLFRNSVEHGSPTGTDASGDERAGLTVTVEATPDGFAVADDGIGISAADRDRVLEVGYSRTDDGTGFGLAIVAEIAAAHGWTVEVGERADGGTRFAFGGVERPAE